MPGFNIKITDDCNQPPADTGHPLHTVETARRHRYSLEVFEPFGTKRDGILAYLSKCQRPAIEFDEIAIHNTQDEISRPGKSRWRPIDFTFYEVLDGEGNNSIAAEFIYKWWSATMVDINTSFHKPPSEYLKNAKLEMLNGNGNAVWVYDIYHAWPSKVNPTDLAYSDSEISEISVTLRYSKAKES